MKFWFISENFKHEKTEQFSIITNQFQLLLSTFGYRDWVKILEYNESMRRVCTKGWSNSLKFEVEKSLNGGYAEFKKARKEICTIMPDDTMIIETNEVPFERFRKK